MVDAIKPRELKTSAGLKDLGQSQDSTHNGGANFYLPPGQTKEKPKEAAVAKDSLVIRRWETDSSGTLLHLDVSV